MRPPLIFLLALGCATAAPVADAPDRAAFLASVYERFPRETHLVGYGVGATPGEAEERAQVDAAAAIRSEIESNSRHLEVGVYRGASANEVQTVTSETVRRVTSDAGAFIRPIRELTHAAGSLYAAVAVASKAELDRKYETETTGQRERLDAIYLRVLSDPGSKQVTAALCEVEPLERQLDAKDVERRLVTGRSAWTPEVVERRRKVAELRQEIKSVARVDVVRGSATVAAEVWDHLVGELSSRGYSARVIDRPSDAGCESASGVSVSVEVDQTCGAAPIGGVRCDVALATRGQRCDESVALFTYSSKRASALHASNKELAAKAAMRKIDMKQFSTQVAGRVLRALGEGCEQ